MKWLGPTMCVVAGVMLVVGFGMLGGYWRLFAGIVFVALGSFFFGLAVGK